MKSKRKKKNRTKIIILVVLAVVCIFAVKQIGIDDGQRIVCIDAGHGGRDVGAVNGSRYEKDDNLRLALKVKEKLEAQEVRVVMTRDDDTFVELKDRCKIANRKHCDLFVAIHRNSAEKGAGVEAWIATTAGRTENSLANDLLDALSGSGFESRGVKRGYRGNALSNYYVNSGTKMPSVLLETGFISSDRDNKLFDEKLDKNAEAIADAIVKNLK